MQWDITNPCNPWITASGPINKLKIGKQKFAPGESTGFNVTGMAASAPIAWIVTRNGSPINTLDACLGDNTDGNGNWSGSCGPWTTATTGDWVVEARVGQEYGRTGFDVAGSSTPPSTATRPVPGDYNGDGVTDAAVFSPTTGEWRIRNVGTVVWGSPGDIPVHGDYNGDGVDDITIWRPSTGEWWIRNVGVINWG